MTFLPFGKYIRIAHLSYRFKCGHGPFGIKGIPYLFFVDMFFLQRRGQAVVDIHGLELLHIGVADVMGQGPHGRDIREIDSALVQPGAGSV